MADPFASFFAADDPVKAILNFGKQGGTYSDQALQFLGQQAMDKGGSDAFFKFGDIASQYSNKGIDSAGAADQIAQLLGVTFGGSGSTGYSPGALDGGDGGGTTGASATATIGTGDGSGATTDWNAVQNEVMGDIRANPQGFNRGTGIANYRTSGGLSLNDLPQDVQNSINMFLGGDEYRGLLGTAVSNDPVIQNEQLRQEVRNLEQQVAQATQPAPVQQPAPQPVQSSGNNMATTALQADSTALGGQMQRDMQQDRLSFLRELIDRDAALQANQQAQVSEYVNQANRAGQEGFTNLNLPTTTTLSPLEQSVQGRLQQRVGTDDFLAGIDQSMGQRAEDLATRRIQQAMGIGGILGQDQNLQNAIDVANQRLMQQGDYIDPSGQLTNAAEKVVMDRLLGGDNPLIQQQRANYLAESADTEAQLRENLNRMGVLRSGDTADVLGDFLGQRDRGLNDINALAYDLQSQALADALGFQGRRDQLAMANQDLRRAAISDVAGLSQQALGRQLSEQDLQRGALSDALGLQSRRDTLGLANQDLQRAALSDALGYQQMSDARARAEAGQRMQGLGLQQDIADRTLNRLLTQTAPTQREIFAEQMRQNQIGNVLAQGEDIRAESALRSDLASSDLQRRLAEAGVTGLYSQGANTPAIQTLQARELAADRALREAGLTGQYQGQDTLAGRQLTDQLLSTALGRDQVVSQDLRERLGLALEAENLGFDVTGIEKALEDVLGGGLSWRREPVTGGGGGGGGGGGDETGLLSIMEAMRTAQSPRDLRVTPSSPDERAYIERVQNSPTAGSGVLDGIDLPGLIDKARGKAETAWDQWRSLGEATADIDPRAFDDGYQPQGGSLFGSAGSSMQQMQNDSRRIITELAARGVPRELVQQYFRMGGSDIMSGLMPQFLDRIRSQYPFSYPEGEGPGTGARPQGTTDMGLLELLMSRTQGQPGAQQPTNPYLNIGGMGAGLRTADNIGGTGNTLQTMENGLLEMLMSGTQGQPTGGQDYQITPRTSPYENIGNMGATMEQVVRALSNPFSSLSGQDFYDRSYDTISGLRARGVPDELIQGYMTVSGSDATSGAAEKLLEEILLRYPQGG